MKIKKKWLSVLAVVAVFGVAFGASYMASVNGLFGDDVKRIVTQGSAVKAEDIQDENGSFVIQDYPEDLDLSGYVVLPDYKNMTVQTVNKPEVTQDRIDANVKSYIAYFGRYEKVTDRPIQAGDIVTISYTGYQDGKEVSNYTASDVLLQLGSEGVPDEFSDNFVGANVGEEKSFDVVFPDDWADETYAGQTMSFKATVSAIDIEPVLSDATVGEITDGEYSTAKEFEDYVAQEIADYDQDQYETTLSDEIMTQLLEDAKFKTVPRELVTWYVAMQMQYYQSMADQYEVSVDQYLQDAGIGDSVDDVLYDMTEQASDDLKGYAVLDAIADAEGISVDPDADKQMLDDHVSDLISSLGLADEDAVNSYYKQSNVYHDIQNQKVVSWLMNTVKQADLEGATAETATGETSDTALAG